MKKDKRNRSKQIMPNELECKILNLVWDGKKGVREVHETMLEDGYIPYTTVMACMTHLADKGLLKQNKKSKAYLYTAVKSKEDTAWDAIETIADKFYGGDVMKLHEIIVEKYL